MFSVILCIYGVHPSHHDVWLVLAFLEFLVFNNKSFSFIVNMVSALKAKLPALQIDTCHFQDKKVSAFVRSLRINRELRPSIKSVFSVHHLHQIVQICDSMEYGYVFKAVYLLAFFHS